MPDTLVSLNPATLVEVGRIPVTSLEGVSRAVTTAHEAFAAWRTDRVFRQELLRECGQELLRQSPQIAALLTAEQGKTAKEAAGELWISVKHFAHAAELVWPDEEPGPELATRTARVQKVPFGVVAAIVPWNFPVFLMVAKLAPALAAGNTVVVKPAESVSLVVDKVVQILQALLPDGVVGVVHGGADVGRALVENRLVRKVSFTGSTTVGRQIMKQAAEAITPVTLELGGNDPAILLEGADMTFAAGALANSAFLNAGQMCVAPKRAYVPAQRADEFCEIFARAISDMVVGDGHDPATTMGPLHSEAQLAVVRGMLDKAVAGGGTIVIGGGRGTPLPGHFLEPTLVRDVDDSAELVALEQFGPVFPVVAYTDLDEVLSQMNSQEFGLGASVWCADEASALAVASRIDAGSVWVNHHNAIEVELPFGGVKSSGFGREGGMAGVHEFLQTRVLSIKHGEFIGSGRSE